MAVMMVPVMMKTGVMMAMMVEVVPMRTVPTMVVMTMMMTPPMHLRRCRLCVLLNRSRGGGIVERERVGALGGCREGHQRADDSQSQNFR